MYSQLKELSIAQVLNEDEYQIPMYQRNYAWGIDEVKQLVEDIADSASLDSNSRYYIGNLVVFPVNQNVYETVDGQQRLTTLNIIACSLKNHFFFDKSGIFDWYKKINLSFSYREISNKALDVIFNYGKDILLNSSIVDIFKDTCLLIENICKDKELSHDDFVNYFLNNVKLLRISLPEDTDLNHYFEIMNSRGEQLEKHEILKARLMEPIEADEAKIFNKIWEACSHMNTYVQMNFSVSWRNILFGKEWNNFSNIDFDSLYQFSSESKEKISAKSASIIDIFNDNNPIPDKIDAERDDLESNEAFNSVIFFPQFLLHALKVYAGVGFSMSLDDKQLLKHFNTLYEEFQNDREKSKMFAKRFIMHLLKLRFLFDQYVIKRKYIGNTDAWSLCKIKTYDVKNSKKASYVNTFEKKEHDSEQKNLVMIQAMFHVSSPAQNYKYWLNASLHYLNQNYDKKHVIEPNKFRNYLYFLAKAYMLDRYLLGDGFDPVDYMDIIYQNNGVPKHSITSINFEHLNKGVAVENFIFNFYDYILWLNDKEHFNKFEFAFRNSVEHFYPQNPKDNISLEEKYLHNFGNLCLISRSMNSKFSNNMPLAKQANFKTLKEVSAKLKIMMDEINSKTSYPTFITGNFKEAETRIRNALEND